MSKLILGIDASAQAASCAVCSKEKVIASAFINVKLTHSQTIMPMVRDMLACAKLNLEEIDAFAVSRGPGSFTGIRIGVSAIKGMAYALGKPCIGVSTLESLAYNLQGGNGIACAVMDARRSQVYTALFSLQGEKITRVCEDKAISISQLAQEIKDYKDEKITLVGEAAMLVLESQEFETLCKQGYNIAPAPAHLQHQLGTSVCAAAFSGEEISAQTLMPSYIRVPQAEREREQRIKNNL